MAALALSPNSLLLLQLYLPLLALLVAAAGGLWHYRRLPGQLRYLAGAAGWVLLVWSATQLLVRLQLPAHYLEPLVAAGEFGLLALAYQAALRSPAFGRWLPWLVGGLAALALVSALAGPGARWRGAGLHGLESVLLLLLAALYFRKLLSELVIKHLERDPMFWLSTGLLIYSLGSIQVSLFSSYFGQDHSGQPSLTVRFVQALLALILYSCYALALWMRPQK